MTVFISIPWFYPAFKAGGPVQSVINLVNEFSDGVQYYIFCSNTDLKETSLDNIETGRWISYNENTKVWYAAKEKRSQTLIELTEKIQPDILYIIGIFSWHFNIIPLLFSKASKKIISTRGMLHPGALSQKKIKKKLFLALWKFLDWHKKASFHATDEDEEKYITQQFGEEVDVVIAANFPRKFKGSTTRKERGVLKLVSVGVISPMKNYLLIIQALKHVEAMIEYRICGPVKDMAYWQLCLEEIKQLPNNISIEYRGVIPTHEVESTIEEFHVFIMPSKSENFGHAFYEALSAGKPVITSLHTPWKNLEEENAGYNIELKVDAIAKSIEIFAAMSQEEYDAASLGAKAYAENALDIRIIRKQYEEMFSINGLNIR